MGRWIAVGSGTLTLEVWRHGRSDERYGSQFTDQGYHHPGRDKQKE